MPRAISSVAQQTSTGTPHSRAAVSATAPKTLSRCGSAHRRPPRSTITAVGHSATALITADLIRGDVTRDRIPSRRTAVVPVWTSRSTDAVMVMPATGIGGTAGRRDQACRTIAHPPDQQTVAPPGRQPEWRRPAGVTGPGDADGGRHPPDV